MRILVTGSSGLVGRELTRHLAVEHEVVPFDLRPLLAGEPAGDIRDTEALRDALDGCDGVFHLAAISRVSWGEVDPATCHAVNVEATRSLIELMSAGAARPWLVFASSREVYGDPPSLLVTEDAPVAPINTYGRSKAEAEAAVAEGRARGLRTATVRLSNVYGTTNDHPDRAVPALLWKALQGEPISLTGGANYFDFVHVADCVSGLSRAAAALASGEEALPTVHLATGVATSLEALAREAIALCESSSTVTKLPERPFDVGGFCGDPARAAAVLGWKAAIPLRAGMERLREEMRYGGRPIAEVAMPRARAAISVEVRQ